jgi:hypothetical protein
MKFSAFVLGFVFTLLFSHSIFSQIDSGEINGKEDLTAKRIALVKADVLREIQTFSNKEQAYFYARLGSIFWEQKQQKEGIDWLTKAVELGISPSNDYKDNSEKLSRLWNLLSNVLKKDAALENKLISKIKEIKIDETNPDVLEDANKTYILIAEQIFTRKGDEKLAFELAMLSLKGKKPAINWYSSEFFRALKPRFENLANAYFAKLVETVKINGNKDLLFNLVTYFDASRLSNYPTKDSRFSISEAQKRDLLELLFPLIQNDSEALALKKKDSCGAITAWGLKYLEDYKRLLPEKSIIVEQAVAICQSAEIEPWKKPDFLKRPRKTSQDLLDLAKEIGDKKVRSNYLENAASHAKEEKNYRLSLNILDGIDNEFRDYFWNFLKLTTSSELVKELFKSGDFGEIKNVLNGLPTEYRPFVIVDAVYSIWRLKPEEKEFVLDLMSQARAGFNKMDKSPLAVGDFTTNPTKFGQMTLLYVKFGFYEEAIAAHEESIKALNRYAENLPEKYKEKNIIPRVSSYSRFTNQYPPNDIDFVNQYFERIYENIDKIENSHLRLSERLGFLDTNLRKPSAPILIPGIPDNIPRKNGNGN